MFHLASTPSRLSQRLTGARARRQTQPTETSLQAAGRTSRGETFAIGLGCDGWKPRSF